MSKKSMKKVNAATANTVNPKTAMKDRRIVTFGYAPKDVDGCDYAPIEWIVLDDSNGLLLISKEIITAASYHRGAEAADGVSWSQSDLRRTLNGEFLNSICPERDRLLPVGIGPEGNDIVSILSLKEVKGYMPAEADRAAEATAYADSRCTDAASWWLRMERAADWHCWSVNTDGSFETDYGYPCDSCGIRPVIRIKQ